MGIIQRQGLWGAFASYLGVLIGAFNVLWLYPRFLQPQEIGLLRALTDTAAILVPFLVMGMPPVCIRYFPMFQHNEQKHYGLLTFMHLVALLGFLVFALLFGLSLPWLKVFVTDSSGLLAKYLPLLLPLCLFMMFYSVQESYSRSLHKTVMPAFINEGFLRLGAGLAVVLYAAGWLGQSGWITMYVGMYGSALLLMVAYLKKLGQWHLPLYIDRRVWQKAPEMGGYAFFVLLGSLGAMLVGKIDSLMVIKLSGLADGGIYSIALFIGTVIEIPRRALSQISAPVVAKQIAQNEWDKVAMLYRRISINQTIVGLLLLLGIWVNINNLFALMPNGSVFLAGKYVVLYIGLAKLIDMCTSINNEIITLSRYYRYYLPMMFVLVSLTIVTNLLLIPPLGITGAAIATLIALLVFNLLKYVFIWWVIGIQPFTIHTLGAFGAAAVTYGVQYFMPNMQHIGLDLMLRSVLVGGVFVALTLLLQLSPDANRFWQSVWHKVTGTKKQ